MAAVAFALIEFGHEGQGFAVLVGDLLGPVLVDGVVVTGDQGIVVAKGDLLLAQVALPLHTLAVHSGTLHAEADIAQQGLHPGRRQHRVVDVVVGGRSQVAVPGFPGGAVTVVEDHELQFGTDERRQPALGEPVELGAQDGSRGDRDRPAVGEGQVRHHQRRTRQPGQPAQGGEIRGHDHVAVAGLPAGHGVAVDGVHVDIHGQQVVAAFGAVRGDLLDEQPRRYPFPGEPALHIGEREDHGVDLAGGDELFQIGLRQQTGVNHGVHSLVGDGAQSAVTRRHL